MVEYHSEPVILNLIQDLHQRWSGIQDLKVIILYLEIPDRGPE